MLSYSPVHQSLSQSPDGGDDATLFPDMCVNAKANPRPASSLQLDATLPLAVENGVRQASSARRLPVVVHFEDDLEALRVIAQCGLDTRPTFEDSQKNPSDAEIVVVCSDERLLAENYAALRAPHIRVIALANQAFQDPRFDEAIYEYLPPATPPHLMARMLNNALDHIHLLSMRREENEQLAGATYEIHELNEIGAALSAEHDTDKLLEMILRKCREITKADSGSLYVVEEESRTEAGAADEAPDGLEPPKCLRFKVAQNDSVNVAFQEITLPINEESIAGYAAMRGEVVMIEDSYRLPAEVPYSVNRKLDEESGYRTKSLLAVPMRDQKGQIVGVLELINAKREFAATLTSNVQVMQQVVPFTMRHREMVSSLASQAAVAFENSQLYASIRGLFEGFVRASVSAIEARDPTTSGHSFRVANLTVALAETIDRDSGVFAAVRFTRDEMREIRYASLLHDFGKVGVRENVLVKAKKLYPGQLEIIRQRFDLVRRTLQAESAQRRIDFVLQNGTEKYLAKRIAFDRELEENLVQLDEYFRVIVQADEPTILPEDRSRRLDEIASHQYPGLDGTVKPLLTDDEMRLLAIPAGSLDNAERLQIESHVVHTYNFLKQIPWTKEIRHIPQIARGHHEKLNGTGYPKKLSAPDIPLQTRMMTLSDIFDALSAADRPYKKAVTTERALEILGFMVKDGEVDGQLFEMFREAKVFEKSLVEAKVY